VTTRLAVAPAPLHEGVSEQLDRLLAQVALRIAEHGTAPDRAALHAVAYATRWLAPGAATALVDWQGSETARLRAFGLLHGVVLRGLDHDDHSWLLGRLRGRDAAEPDGRVA
jgi:hypothetical protein